MIRRLFWLLVGVALGVAGSIWVVRTLRLRVFSSRGGEVALDVGSAARRLLDEVRDAVDEGRVAMREREAELRSRLEAPAVPAALPPGTAEPDLVALAPGRDRARARVRAR